MTTGWLPRLALRAMQEEGDSKAPLETGGILMGYWVTPVDAVVITGVIGPGPKAVHARSRFVPDAEYQEAEVARVYRTSGRLHTYLGDWHTHPRMAAYLSGTDRRTLCKIARTPGARSRVPGPLMAVLAGGAPWELRAWYLAPSQAMFRLHWPQLRPLEIAEY